MGECSIHFTPELRARARTSILSVFTHRGGHFAAHVQAANCYRKASNLRLATVESEWEWLLFQPDGAISAEEGANNHLGDLITELGLVKRNYMYAAKFMTESRH